jgi:hypothetical protein
MKVVQVSDFGAGKWTRIILDDGRSGWLKGEPQPDLVAHNGMISQFSYKDARSFFITRNEPKPRIGILLHWANVGSDNRAHGGDIKQIVFSDPDLGELTLPATLVKRIEIDRTRELPVELATTTSTYRDDFTKSSHGKNLFVVTRPFVCVKDFRNEIDLIRSSMLY